MKVKNQGNGEDEFPLLRHQQNKCWPCTLLQSTDMLKLYIWYVEALHLFSFATLCSVLNVMLWQCCVKVKFRHKNHLVRIGKRSGFVISSLLQIVTVDIINIWLCCHQNGLKMSHRHVKNIQWFHAYKCWNAVLNSGLWQVSSYVAWGGSPTPTTPLVLRGSSPGRVG